jgi:selenophosphate synthetase-related protein
MAEEIKNKGTVDETKEQETPVNPEPATDPVDQKDPKKKELTIKLPDVKAGAKKFWKGAKKVAGGIAVGAVGGLAMLGGLAYIGSKMDMKPLPEPEEDDDQDEEEKEDEES